MNKQISINAGALFALGLFLSSCGEDSGAKNTAAKKNNAVPVNVQVLTSQTVPLVEEMPGRTVAFRKTDVRPQVDGIVKERHFKEGAFVETGQPLYTIDAAVYQAALDAAKAEVARVQASLSQAEKSKARYASLIKRQATSQQNYDDAVAAEAQARAAVAAAQAKLDQATINMEYTVVKAKISGQIGASIVNEGSLVTASQASPLATVTQLDPIYVDVTQAGGKLLKIKQAIQSGRIQGIGQNQIDVSLIIDATGMEYPHKGTLQFSDVTVNETTGTVRLRAVFPNPDHELLPGMFVRGKVRQGEMENAYLIAQKAVMRRPDGTAYVYVVENDVVATRDIGIEQAYGPDWIVTSGVQNGDLLITDGLQRVAPNSPVTYQKPDAAAVVK